MGKEKYNGNGNHQAFRAGMRPFETQWSKDNKRKVDPDEVIKTINALVESGQQGVREGSLTGSSRRSNRLNFQFRT